MSKHSVEEGVGHLSVVCREGVLSPEIFLRADVVLEWSSALSHPQPCGHSFVIVLWVMGMEGTVRDILPPAVGGDSTESTPVVCPACPPQASLVMTIIPDIQLSIPGMGRTWGRAREPCGEKYICAAEAPSVSSSSSSSSFRPLS